MKSEHAKLRVATGVACIGLLAAACGSAGHAASSDLSSSAPSTSVTTPASGGSTSTPPPTVAPATSSSGRKAPLVGLIDMGYQGPYIADQPFPATDPSVLDAYAGAFSGIVVNESWSQLEPSNGVYDWAPLDESLANVSAWNAQHPSTPLGVKLRIFAGQSAPAWVISASGPEVAVTIGLHASRNVSVGRFWTGAFRQAWSTFQHAMAARYDGNPLIRAVSVSSCSSSTGEPFIVPVAGMESRDAMEAAGWSVQAQESCLQGALGDYSGWKLTPVTFAFNPLPTAPGFDQAFTTSVMEQCAASAANGGPVCQLGNNALSSTAASGGLAGTYAEIASLESAPADVRPGVYFQTVGSTLDCSSMSLATGYHASSVEVWPPIGRLKGFAAIPEQTLAQWNSDLIDGQQISC